MKASKTPHRLMIEQDADGSWRYTRVGRNGRKLSSSKGYDTAGIALVELRTETVNIIEHARNQNVEVWDNKKQFVKKTKLFQRGHVVDMAKTLERYEKVRAMTSSDLDMLNARASSPEVFDKLVDDHEPHKD